MTSNKSSLITYNLYGLDLIGQVRREGATWNRYYFLKDHLGSVRVIVDASGNVVAYDDYYPFGMQMPGRTQESSSVDGRYKFTGKERDAETEYDYFGARYYDARIGRWLQVDPMAEKYIGISPYQYSFNNPVRYYDPDGKFVVESKRGGVIAHRYTKSEYRTAQVFEFLPVLSTASLINRTLRGDPSFSPGLGTWLIQGASVGTGLGLGYLTTFMKQAKPIERAIVKFIAQRSEAVVSLPTIELEKGSREMIAEDKAIFEKALSKEIEEGVPLAVPAQFVTTHYYGRGEREGYYAPDEEAGNGVPTLIMLNPELEEKWREKRLDPKEEFNRWLESLRIIILLILLPLLLLACISGETNEDIVLSDNNVVFVESRSEKHGIRSGDFGNVVLFDLSDEKKYYVTDDRYYHKETTISYDKRKIAFLSNRIGTRTELRIKGIAPPHEIYVFCIEDKKLSRIGEKLEKLYPEIMNGLYYGLKWNANDNSLFFSDGRNDIYEIFIEHEDSISKLKHIIYDDWDNLEIIDFSFSPDNKMLAVAILETRFSLSPKRKLIVYNMEDNDSLIIYETYKALNTGAWSHDSNTLLFRAYKHIYEYNFKESGLTKLYDQTEVETVRYIDRPYYTPDGEIIFLAQRVDNSQDDTYGVYEVFILNQQKKELKQITNDGLEKRYLDVSLRPYNE